MSNTKTQHTPTPWIEYGDGWIRDPETDGTIAHMEEHCGHCDPEYQTPMPRDANARVIVHRVNTYEALVDVLEQIAKSHPAIGRCGPVREALRIAKEEA